MVMLDTCALLWLVADQERLSTPARESIAKNAEMLFVSSITAFEVAIKHRNGKLRLPLPPADWFSESLEFHGIRELPVTSSIAVLSVQLPPLHNDPCDRIIIATAEINGMGIITSDNLFAQYDCASVIW